MNDVKGKITDEKIIRAHQRCCEILQREVFQLKENGTALRRLDPGTIVALLAWE